MTIHQRKLCSCGAPRYLDGVKCKRCLQIDAIFAEYRKVPPRKNNTRATIPKREALKRRLDAVCKGEPLTAMTIQKLRKRGFIKVTYVPELVLTDKGRKVIGGG